MADKEWVIHSGPYYYNNKPRILWPLELDFELSQEHLSVLPLWVKLLGLPVGYRSIEGLSKVASAIEKPIRADNYTANVDKISYARVLIEVDVSQRLPDHIHIETVEGLWRQPVAYDWRPKYYNNCLIFGMRRRNVGTRRRKMRVNRILHKEPSLSQYWDSEDRHLPNNTIAEKIDARDD
ncbi:putative treacle protein-like [Capsicum annuum]|nr:putative treacle protein-like [Capsicum annuum]KAF3685183.1 putative treacle protein-like [Capsicum annuum]